MTDKLTASLLQVMPSDSSNDAPLPHTSQLPSSRKQLRKDLKAVHATPFQRSILKWLGQALRLLAPRITDLPLHETCTLRAPRQSLGSNTREALFRTLEQPSTVAGGSDDISPKLPDICLAYHLSKEHGRIVNVPEWFTAFRAVRKDDKNKATTQARFVQAVSELQAIGVVRRTSRRTDAVERMVFAPVEDVA
mmetsp:Transcript_16912/g.36637  ORF Transcript_16912/g.36637 Transcript_16912/m.36637 type:complete len:193 (-) Transcript_16912:35-613(-)